MDPSATALHSTRRFLRRLESVTDPEARLQRGVDALPAPTRVRPCRHVRNGHSVFAPDLRTETRWLDWCAAAVDQLELTAALSVLLASTGPPLATLNLYSDTGGGLSSVDLGLLHTLTGPLAGALLDAQAGAGRLGPAA